MLPEMKELAELVEPHVWWSDGDWETTYDLITCFHEFCNYESTIFFYKILFV